MTPVDNSEAWRAQGAKDRQDGKLIDACPYRPGTVGEHHWKYGWSHYDEYELAS